MKVTPPDSEQWRTERQSKWDTNWLPNKFEGEGTREEALMRDATAAWYLKGDLTPLINLHNQGICKSSIPLGWGNVIYMAPIIEPLRLVEFIQELAYLFEELQIGPWYPSEVVQRQKSERLLGHMLHHYMGRHDEQGEEVHSFMLENLLPNDEGVVRFNYPLGKEELVPAYQIDINLFALDLLDKIGEYLYGDGAKDNCCHIKKALTRLSLLEKCDKRLFDLDLGLDLDLADDEDKPLEGEAADKGPLWPYQVSLRYFLYTLQGYNIASYPPLEHNDVEFESQVLAYLNSLSVAPQIEKLNHYLAENAGDEWLLFRKEHYDLDDDEVW